MFVLFDIKAFDLPTGLVVSSRLSKAKMDLYDPSVFNTNYRTKRHSVMLIVLYKD